MPTQEERDCVISDLCSEARELRAEIARLEDLRRWRPMSEEPEEEGFYCARPGKNPWVECWVWKDGHWNHRGASYATENLSGWEWTYIPGQEPKEEV